jgi:hypothetical protein
MPFTLTMTSLRVLLEGPGSEFRWRVLLTHGIFHGSHLSNFMDFNVLFLQLMDLLWRQRPGLC